MRLKNLVPALIVLSLATACTAQRSGNIFRNREQGHAQPADGKRTKKHVARSNARFLYATRQHEHKESGRAPAGRRLVEAEKNGRPDIWEMQKWYEDRRKNEHGVVDWASYRREIAHRASMAPGHIGHRLGNAPLPNARWQYIGPNNFTGPNRQYYALAPVSGRVNAVAYDPGDENTIYIGAADGGVWFTNDGGNTWVCTTDAWPHLNVSCITVDPNNNNTIYAGTGDYAGSFTLGDASEHGFGYGIGVMKSTDGGASWVSAVQASSSAAFGGACVSSIMVSPSNSNVVIATTGRGEVDLGKVWRSTDGGITWKDTGLPAAHWCSSAMGIDDAVHPRVFYVVSGNPNVYAYYSEDQGATWKGLGLPASALKMANQNDSVVIASSQNSWDKLYVMINAVGGGGITYTPDLGAHYYDITGNFESDGGGTAKYNWSQAFYNYFLGCYSYHNFTTQTDQDALVAGNIDVQVNVNTTKGTWGSIGGPTWDPNKANLHNDQHAIDFSRQNTQHMAIGCDGGFYLVNLDPNSGNFQTFSANIPLGITQLYSVDVAANNQYAVMGGAQDNGVPTTLPNPTSASTFANWSQTRAGGDGTSVLFTSNPSVAFCCNEQLKMWETTDGGTTWQWITYQTRDSKGNYHNYLDQPAAWVAPIAVDNTHGWLFGGTNRVWRYAIGTKTWTQTGAIITPNGVVSALAESGDNTRVFAGGSVGYILMSSDGGATFQSIRGDVPWDGRYVSAISVAPGSNKDIIVTTSTAGARNVWRCMDVTAAAPHWIDVDGPSSGNAELVQAPVNAIVRDFDSPSNTWYVGTDIGAFMTTDAGNSWQEITQSLGLPNVQVNSLVAHSASREIYAGTYGRGIWRIHDAPVGLELYCSPSPVALGNQTNVVLKFADPVPAGGYSVTFQSSDPTTVPVPSQPVQVPAGKTEIEFPASVPINGRPSMVTISAIIGQTRVNATLNVIQPAVAGNQLSAYTIFGGSDFPSWTITLQNVAGKGGVTINCASSNTAVVKPQYGYFSVPEGYSQASMALSTFPVKATTNVNLTVFFQGGYSTVVLVVKPVQLLNFTLDQNSLFGGTGDTSGTVYLNYTAPSNPANVGSTVSLLSSNPAAASIDKSTLTIPTGYSQSSFPIHPHMVAADTTVTFTATLNGSILTQQLLVKRNYPTSLTVDKETPVGGVDGVSGTVVLKTIANVEKSAGATVSLKGSNSLALTVPPTVAVTAGYSQTSFSMTTSPVAVDTPVTITATLNSVSVTHQITVKAIYVSSVVLSAKTAYGGVDQPSGTVNLNFVAAGPKGTTVVMTSSVPAAASVQPTLLVTSGYSQSGFNITTKSVTVDTPIIITASLNGKSQSASLTVKAVLVGGLVLTGYSAYGGTEFPVATVSTNYVVPPNTNIGLRSSVPSAAFVPASVPIATGYQQTSFVVTTYPVSAVTNAVITASLNGSSQYVNLTVKPNGVASLTFDIYKAVGGVQNPNGTATLQTTAAQAHGTPLTLTSSDMSAATVTSTTVQPGYMQVGFAVTTKYVTATKTVIITATANGMSKPATIVVDTVPLTGLKLGQSSIKGGSGSVTATLTLQEAAPIALTVTLQSNSSAATPPATVVIPANSQTYQFQIPTTKVSTLTHTTIKAFLGTSSAWANLAVNP